MTNTERTEKMNEGIKLIQEICNDYNLTIDSEVGGMVEVVHHDLESKSVVTAELVTCPF